MRKTADAIWILALLMLSVLPSPAAPVGLIDQPQTFPWSVGLTPVVQEESGGLAAGTFRVQSSVLWFNTYRQFWVASDLTQQIDMEGLLEMLSLAWSPAPGWEIRAQAQGWLLGGGIMDSLLAGFHNSLNLNNQGRESVPDRQYRDFLKGSFDLSTPNSGLTQFSLGARYFTGPWSLSAWVKPPLPAPIDWAWSGRWSGGVGAGWGERWTWVEAGLQFGAGASIAAIAAEEDPNFPGVIGRLAPQFGFYGTLSPDRRLRALVQGSWTGMPRTGDSYLSEGAGLLTSGIQWNVGGAATLEAAVTEEFLTWATMEVGLQLGLIWSIPALR